MIRTLITEDDALLAASLKSILELHGHTVKTAGCFQEALSKDFLTFDFFCVDLHLPDGSGIRLCREIRKAGPMPILVLTAYEEEEYAVRAFEAGADDYVIKPFRSRELMARVAALLRRSRPEHTVRGYRSGSLFVSVRAEEVRWEGQLLDFTRKEYEILLLLLRRGGQRVSREELFSQVWGASALEVEDNTLSVTVGRLRKKLERIGCPGAIETCWGRGYRWLLPVEEDLH